MRKCEKTTMHKDLQENGSTQNELINRLENGEKVPYKDLIEENFLLRFRSVYNEFVDKPMYNFREITKEKNFLLYKKNECYIYCSKCKAFHIGIEMISLNSSSENYETYNINEIICSNCRTSHTLENTYHLSKQNGGHLFYYSPKIFIDNHLVKVKWIYDKYTGYNDKIQRETYKQHITFNTKTGQTYAFAPVNNKGKIDSNFHIKQKIINITYGSIAMNCFPVFTSSFKKEIILALQNTISKNLGYQIPLLQPDMLDENKEYYNNVAISNMCYYNRFPNFNFIQISAIKYIKDFNGNFLYFKKIKNSSDDYIKDLFLKNKVPFKNSYRKILLIDLRAFIICKNFSQIIKDENVILNILKSSIKDSFFNNQNLINLRFDKNNLKFLKEWRKIFKNDVDFGNKFVKDKYGCYLLEDTATMYSQINTIYKDQEIVKSFNFSKNLKQMHDDLTYIINLAKKKNVELKYTEKEMNLNEEINGFNFILAKDTAELYECGKKMNICVGSYTNRALDRTKTDESKKYGCGILFIKKDDEYIGCIELDYKLSTIYQAKAKFNKYLTDEPLKALEIWIKKHEININTNDLDMLKTVC